MDFGGVPTLIWWLLGALLAVATVRQLFELVDLFTRTVFQYKMRSLESKLAQQRQEPQESVLRSKYPR